MHDWTLLSITIDWKAGEATLRLTWRSEHKELLAIDLREIRIPRSQPWGPSVSINKVEGPKPQDDGMQRLTIEIQSGDLIEIVARAFRMPM